MKYFHTTSSSIVQIHDKGQCIRRQNSWLCCSSGAQATFKRVCDQRALCSRTSLQYCYLICFHWGGLGFRLTQVKISRKVCSTSLPRCLHLAVTWQSREGSRDCVTTSHWTNLPLLHVSVSFFLFSQHGRQNTANPHGPPHVPVNSALPPLKTWSSYFPGPELCL